MTKIEGFLFPHRVVSASRREELKRKIKSNCLRGELSDLIFYAYSRIFNCQLPADCASAKSLIVAAVPRPQTRVIFTWESEALPVLIPPTYVRYWAINKQIEEELNLLLQPQGFWARFALVPQKLLAVRSGLAKYGRNNITYIPQLGSFYQLVSYYSDLPAEEDLWQEPQLMDSCQACSACRQACPTGAIGGNQFSIRQDRCLTFYSGYSKAQARPDWLSNSWLDCLIGCLRCQLVCPENRRFLGWIEEEDSFSEEETELLWRGLATQTVPVSIRQKLENLGLIQFFGTKDCLEMIAYMLDVFIRREKRKGLKNEDLANQSI